MENFKSRMDIIYKKGDRSDRSKYSPLQMPYAPSKLLEGLVCALQPKLATKVIINGDLAEEGLLIYLTETWRKAVNNGKWLA